MLGQPLMDFFHQRSHAPLKGALVAASQGRWTDHSLASVAVLPGGSELAVDLEFERFEFEGEPAVRLRVATQKRDLKSLTSQLEEALRFDTSTGLLKRAAFREQATAQATAGAEGGHARRGDLRAGQARGARTRELGPLAVEDVMDELGALLRSLAAARRHRRPRHRAAGSRSWPSAATRATSTPGSDACCSASRSMSSSPASITRRRLPAARAPPRCNSQGEVLAAPLESSVSACRAAAAARRQPPAAARRRRRTSPTSRRPTANWAAQIKAALMANRFRLVQQPIASLVGEGEAMFDLVVRMLDEKGNEVLPSEFLAAAERTDLMKNIDRWVIGAAMSFCARTQAAAACSCACRATRCATRRWAPGCTSRSRPRASTPRRVVIEIGEELATRHLKEARELRALVTHLGFGFAIENFGSGRDSAQTLRHLPSNYVKIDGALMQGLANDRRLQEQVKSLVDLARAQRW